MDCATTKGSRPRRTRPCSLPGGDRIDVAVEQQALAAPSAVQSNAQVFSSPIGAIFSYGRVVRPLNKVGRVEVRPQTLLAKERLQHQLRRRLVAARRHGDAVCPNEFLEQTFQIARGIADELAGCLG